MKTLRFLCFASLLVVILLAGSANQAGTAADIGASKPPTAVDQGGNVTTENRHSSGTILITMTGMVGDPGDLGP